jgi:hypothetical protein
MNHEDEQMDEGFRGGMFVHGLAGVWRIVR